MKKVRFVTPSKTLLNRMEDSECHSPRPFIQKQISNNKENYNFENILVFSSDPVDRYDSSNSSPYPVANKTNVPDLSDRASKWPSSSDLDLSILDTSRREPQHKPRFFKSPVDNRSVNNEMLDYRVLSLIEHNKIVTPPNILSNNNDFFIKRGNLDRYRLDPVHQQFNKLSLKKDDPVAKKTEIMKMGVQTTPLLENQDYVQYSVPKMAVDNDCRCHHSFKFIQSTVPHNLQPSMLSDHHNINCIPDVSHNKCHCFRASRFRGCLHCDQNVHIPKMCQCDDCAGHKLQNAVDKKTWAIEKYEQSKKADCRDVEKQTNVKEKREPTVVDLFRIIKLQNEQLQLLQEKVDKFVSAHNHVTQNAQQLPVQNFMSEHAALQTIDSEISEQHKISIGVMTSFEMVRTSTVINQEFVKQTKENAQIQCNRSEISIKEVVSKTQPVNLNFLDGIIPVGKTMQCDVNVSVCETNDQTKQATSDQQTENVNDDKTLNELSLYNVQVDNATTPLISPEQSLYLDVRDYSDSESGSDDHSNVGWTYYNKVMTHVNGMLHDSDMPSSASALYRNTQQQCVQMQIDKSNLSVAKRVKFGDDPLGIRQPHIYATSTTTDTSMKMNQLAAKYLKTGTSSLSRAKKSNTKPIDMSFATRNYMERHQLLQGLQTASTSPPAGEMPRFLDITALKQQSKLL